MTGMANLRALKTELFTTEHATVCLIQLPELELFPVATVFIFVPVIRKFWLSICKSTWSKVRRSIITPVMIC